MIARLRTAALVALAAICVALPAGAQEMNNEYWKSRGTHLLRTVEQYHLYPGEDHFRNRHYEQAFNDFSFLLRYFPNHPRGMLLMVQLCTEWKSSRCALDVMFDNALAVKPDAGGTYIVKGIYLHRIKRYEDAIASYRHGLELDPDSMNGHYNLALTYLETRQYDLANRHAQRAYALGAQLPGLRDRLQKLGKWNPSVGPAAADAAPAGANAAASTGNAPVR